MFFEIGNVKFIKDSGSTKIKNISFEEERIDNPTIVIASATSSGMLFIPYIMDVAYLVGVVNQNILVTSLI